MPAKAEKQTCWTREAIEQVLPNPIQERDDINKLPLSRGAKAYARRKGLAAMKRQPHEFQKVNATITNPGKRDHFQNYTVGQSTDGKAVNGMKNAIKDSVTTQVVEAILA